MSRTLFALVLALAVGGCEPPKAEEKPASKAAEKSKTRKGRVPVGKNVELEIRPDGSRRVRVAALVCLREGQLEMFLCKRYTKEHESVVCADVDARDVHKALLAAGAIAGTPVRWEPEYKPATGSAVKVIVEYQKDGKTVSHPANQWVRDGKTGQELATDWVFGGSAFFPDPDDDPKNPKKPPQYAANGGDLVCVSNFETAMLDLPVNSPKDNEGLMFEAYPGRVPDLGTPVTVILEPVVKKADQSK